MALVVRERRQRRREQARLSGSRDDADSQEDLSIDASIESPSDQAQSSGIARHLAEESLVVGIWYRDSGIVKLNCSCYTAISPLEEWEGRSKFILYTLEDLISGLFFSASSSTRINVEMAFCFALDRGPSGPRNLSDRALIFTFCTDFPRLMRMLHFSSEFCTSAVGDNSVFQSSLAVFFLTCPFANERLYLEAAFAVTHNNEQGLQPPILLIFPMGLVFSDKLFRFSDKFHQLFDDK
ncbi:unnamed protein product [Schistocephalus solidus]|uniref:Uncharacterized protein n=1 Tax=Schistocephalus solidus TaxID=70667 RepID=A0A183S9R0_SCHSO|nr:unnamed protein product [Schistocephalus solidus]